MNDILHDIVLSSNEFKMLENELKDGKMAKSILLISKDEKYSFYFAKLLSCLLFDRDIKDESENYIKVFSNSHPDLKIYPSKGKLLVQDSEDIVFESAVKPIFADKKIFIINKIEESMEAAQNKLLKTLEEPLPSLLYFNNKGFKSGFANDQVALHKDRIGENKRHRKIYAPAKQNSCTCTE